MFQLFTCVQVVAWDELDSYKRNAIKTPPFFELPEPPQSQFNIKGNEFTIVPDDHGKLIFEVSKQYNETNGTLRQSKQDKAKKGM